MKYFARIDDKQIGPLTLSELVEAGLRPSDYVWHKGMADWERADEVPEVCRGMRRYLAGYDPETGELRSAPAAGPAKAKEKGNAAADTGDDAMIGGNARMWLRNIPEGPDRVDYTVKPRVSVTLAILATLCCFPLTGLVAIWYAMKCTAHWKMATQPGIAAADADRLRRMAHNDARLYKMMMGITFCLGLLMIGFTLFRT